MKKEELEKRGKEKCVLNDIDISVQLSFYSDLQEKSLTHRKLIPAT